LILRNRDGEEKNLIKSLLTSTNPYNQLTTNRLQQIRENKRKLKGNDA
jgi:hypothetical protein